MVRYSKKKTKSKKNPKVGRNHTRRRKTIDNLYSDYIVKKYDDAYKVNKLDTSTGGINWGLGVEHEAQLFHISKNEPYSFKNTNILFDSQESTCYLTHDKTEKGSCCKSIKNCYYSHPMVRKLMKSRPNIKQSESEFLKNIPWELTGRQSSMCSQKYKVVDGERKPIPVKILNRAPTLMPEFITTKHKNRTIESINNELLYVEKKFIDLQMKNPHTRQKVKKYGEIRTVPYGTANNILVPIKPTMGWTEYDFEEDEKYLDYTGSYHVTITLPCRENISDYEFIKLHQNFANQFQWIEPLLLASLFSGDPRTITEKDYNKKIRGSFRILATGWGNLAGSNVRKLGTSGVGRYSNIESVWRKGLNFNSTKNLIDCDEKAKKNKNIKKRGSILSSDIRTFNFDFSNNCAERTGRPDECPKVSGGNMVHPNGMEIRIFDHFNSVHLIDLLRFMVYLSENARLFETRNYVYSNLTWKTTVRNIMKNGWRAILSDKYIDELRKNLNLELNFKNKTAFGFLEALNEELFMKHKSGFFPSLLIEKKYREAPDLPELNRFSWQISFNNEYEKTLKELMKNNFKKGQKITMSSFENVIYTKFSKKIWKDYIEDILFALESKPYKMVELIYPTGVITGIKYIG